MSAELPGGTAPPEPAPEATDVATDAVSLSLPVTGNDAVDEALSRLADLDELPTAEHAEVYEDVQTKLQRSLADLDGR